MANSLVQFRIDESLRQQASALCEKLGLDLSTYLRMSLAKLVLEQGVPFSVKIKPVPVAEEAIAAMRKLSDLSQANGNSKMSLAEINAEISAARAGR